MHSRRLSLRWKRAFYLLATLAVLFTVALPPGARAFDWAPAPDADVNLNYHVDLADLVLVGSHYDQFGPSGWRRYDVVRDGLIGLADVSYIGARYDTFYDWQYYVTEMDWPLFYPRWEDPLGPRTLYYRWLDGEIPQGSDWRTAFESAVSDWNGAEYDHVGYGGAAFQLVFNNVDVGVIKFGTYSYADQNQWGYTACTPPPSLYTTVCISEGNLYPQLWASQRRGAANHELLHGLTVGHVGDIVTAILRPGIGEINRDVFYVPQNDDVFLVHQTTP
jgi:hypothetical protein